MAEPLRVDHEESRVERLRRLIEEHYRDHPTGTGGSFGEILCHEIHEEGMTFCWLAEKWGISLPTLGELIHDHCKRLEDSPTFAGVRSPLPSGTEEAGRG